MHDFVKTLTLYRSNESKMKEIKYSCEAQSLKLNELEHHKNHLR